MNEHEVDLDSNRKELKFVVKLPHAFCVASPQSVLEVAQAAEDLGYFGVSAQDHLIAIAEQAPCLHDNHGPSDDRTMYESLQTLAWAGGVTNTIRLVGTVFVLPLRNAVRFAKTVATLDVFSGGRTIVGVGVGAPPGIGKTRDGGQNLTLHGRVSAQESALMGVEGRRATRIDEALTVMKSLWSDQPAAFDGEFYKLNHEEMYPKPVQQPGPPIWVGGRSEAARTRAIRFGDGWTPSHIDPDQFRDGLEWMRRRSAELGEPAPASNGIIAPIVIGNDDAAARSELAERFPGRFTSKGLDSHALWGTPETIRQKLGNYVDAGASVFDLYFASSDVDGVLQSLALMAKEVLPYFENQ